MSDAGAGGREHVAQGFREIDPRRPAEALANEIRVADIGGDLVRRTRAGSVSTSIAASLAATSVSRNRAHGAGAPDAMLKTVPLGTSPARAITSA